MTSAGPKTMAHGPVVTVEPTAAPLDAEALGGGAS
jgi:hypothetical protein